MSWITTRDGRNEAIWAGGARLFWWVVRKNDGSGGRCIFRGWDARFDEEIDADHAERFLPPYSSVEDWRTSLERR